jgi:hypothetical protein
MIDERLKELMNAEVDGENSPEASAELRRILETSAEARAYYDDLVELGRKFGEAREVEPPAAAHHRATARRMRTANRRATLAGGLRDLLSPRLACAFAAGAVAGAVILAVVTGAGTDTDALDPNALRGTLAAWEPPSEIDAGECLRFDVPSGSGSGCVSYASTDIWAELHLDTVDETEVVFLHDGDVRFDRFRVVEAGDHSVSVTDGRATLTHSGLGDYVILFEDQDEWLSSLSVEVYSAGELQFEKQIQPVHE